MQLKKYKLIEIEEIEEASYNGDVYDLEVEKDHSYNIDGIAVHNSVCTTRIKTGFGFPQLSAVQNIYKYLVANDLTNIKLIADGGIKQEGDIVKALVGGADFVMIGGMIAGTDKTPGQVISMHGDKYKMYEGMASTNTQVSFFNKSSDDIAPEGESTQVKYLGKGSFEKKVKNIKKYIQTGMSYAGCHDLEEFKKFGLKDKNWIIQTLAGTIEGTPHGI